MMMMMMMQGGLLGPAGSVLVFVFRMSRKFYRNRLLRPVELLSDWCHKHIQLP